MRDFTWRALTSTPYKRATGDELPSGGYASAAIDQHAKSWCGCCYIVAVAQMIEDRVRIARSKKYGRSVVQDGLSIQSLMDHFDERLEGWSACHGGFPLHVLECIASNACPMVWTPKRESTWLGFSRNLRYCLAPNPWNGPKVHTPRRVHVSEVERIILHEGPIVLEVNGDTLKTVDKRGVVTDLTPRPPNHAVCVVGWKGNHWIVRNSWGTRRVPVSIPKELSCVGPDRNECTVEWQEWSGDPRDPGFLFLPKSFPPLHDRANPPWVKVDVVV